MTSTFDFPKAIFLFCLSFIFGITLRSFWDINYLFFSDLFFISSTLAILFSIKKRKIFVLPLFLSIIFLGFAIGILRLDSSLTKPDNLHQIRDTEKTFEIIGVIKAAPNPRIDNIQYTLVTPKKDKVLLSAPIFPKYFYNDKIKIKGKFQTPAEFEDFSYKDFLLKDGIRTVSYYPEIKLKDRQGGLYANILKIKEVLRKTNKKILPSPASEVLGAMILGDKGLLTQDIKDGFSKTGLSHILAISGMHIAIIVGIFISILNRTKLKDKTFYVISTFLVFYVLLVGLPPSAIRASIMATILLLATKVHREYVSRRALVVAGFLMLMFNPLLLRFDVGFQLSFLAVFGILEIGPPTKNFLQKIFRGRQEWLSSILAITLSAQIFTLPIIIYNFGQFSLISPIANIIVVPLLPIVISLGFLILIIGSFSTSIGIFIAFPLYIILSFIIWLAEFSTNLKFSAIEIKNIGSVWIIIIYLIMLSFIWKLKSQKEKLTKEQ